jgi:CheY-like chemotaxis protein
MTEQLTNPQIKRKLFYQELKRVLNNLYDPSVIKNSVILDWLAIENTTRSSFLLQDLIIQSIEALKPNLKIPANTKSWRTYQVLRQRYVEQVNQERIGANLSLSIRQVQREEKSAREVLLEYLWVKYQLDDKTIPAALEPPQTPVRAELLETDDGYQSIRQELNQLTASVPKTLVDLSQEISQVLSTLEPFARQMDVEFKLELFAGLPPVLATAPVLHQAFTHLLMTSAKVCAGSSILIEAAFDTTEILISITGERSSSEIDLALHNSFELAVEMFQLCGSKLLIAEAGNDEPYLDIKVAFISQKQDAVLIVDDNSDSLLLFQRYLAGSSFQPTLIQNPHQVVETALRIKPKAIIIDVMMPDQDGWMTLRQLRNDPETQHIPVIISTILPQRELAFTMGVADFLQKPVKQAQLLEALKRLVNPEVQKLD